MGSLKSKTPQTTIPSKGNVEESKGNASVTLLTSHLGSIGKWGIALTPYLGELGKHWAALIQLEGDSYVYLCEKYAEDDDKENNNKDLCSATSQLTCKRMSKEDALEGQVGVKLHNLGNVHIDDGAELMEICKKLDTSDGKYNLLFNNCQHWIQELFNSLGLNISGFLARQWVWLSCHAIDLLTMSLSYASPVLRVIVLSIKCFWKILNISKVLFEWVVEKYIVSKYITMA